MFDSNDPRLTAYVLGELDDASRVELEAELAGSPELRRGVEEIRQAAQLLRETLHGEPAASLTEGQRQAIRDASRREAAAEVAVPSAVSGSSASTNILGDAPDSSISAPTASNAPWLRTVAAIAALLLVGVAGVAGWRIWSDRDSLDGEGVVAMNSDSSAPAHQSAPPQPTTPWGELASPETATAPESGASPHRRLSRDAGETASERRLEKLDAEMPLTDDQNLPASSESGLARDFDAAGRGAVRKWYGSEVPRADDFFAQGNVAAGLGGAAPPGGSGAFGAEPPRNLDESAGRGEAGGGFAGRRRSGLALGPGSGNEGEPARVASNFENSDGDGVDMEFSDFAPPASNTPATRAAQPPGPRGIAARSMLPPPAAEPAPVVNDAIPADAVSPPDAPSASETASPRPVAAAQDLAPVPAPAQRPAAAPESELRLADVRATTEDLEERLSRRRSPLVAKKPEDAPGDGTSGLGQVEQTVRESSEGGERGEQAQQGGQQQGQQADRQKAGENAEGLRKSEVAGDKDAAKQSDKKQGGNQARTWRRVKAVPNASRLMIGDRDELPLQGMQANVTIDGFRARVLLDLYFYNDRGQQLEGEFKLRLPNEGSLYYFAFGESSFEYRPMVDQLATRGFLTPELIRASGTGPEEILRARSETWTKVKEARIVPREKAAHAYSETVRRRVDPALVEWSGAGVFNSRVFPLMPGKLHRVVVGYDVNLTQDGDALTHALDLPEDLSQVHVDVNVAAVPGAEAQVTPAARPFLASGRAYYHLEGPWSEPLRVRITSPETLVLHGKDSQENRFFATRVAPQLDPQEAGAGSPHAVFLVDTSLSANPDKFNVWLKLLEATLTKNRDTMRQFAVLFFNVESHWWKEKYVANNQENVQDLLNYCNTLALEGATDLRQALAEATSPTWDEDHKPASQPDLFLLSDGAVTWGEQNLHMLAQTLRSGTGGTLFAFQTGLSGTAVGVLEHLARESGGAVFSVAHEQEVDTAATAHRQRPWRLIDVAVPGGNDLLVAGRPKSIYPGQSLLLVGRGQPGNEVVLRVGRGDEEETIRIALGEAVESEAVARLYGQVAVGQLEDLGTAVEDVAVAYARHFRVTGQTCSLLMLESDADYQRFNIRPEDDAFVVKSSAASEVVANKLDELGDSLTDPKKAFEQWLAKMENAPGVRFRLSTAMKLAFERLPATAIDVEPSRLVCKSRSRDDLTKKFFQQLEAGQFDYDAISAEAARRLEAQGPADALKAISNLIENSPGDPVLARDVAFSAMEWGLGGQAYWLLRRVADSRPYEPQIYQALAQCAAEMGNADLAIVYYEVALGGQWHERYQDVHRVAGVEYLHLLRRIDRGDLSSHLADYAKARLDSLVNKFEVDQADLVITLMWNTDRTDVDLHVLEPSGEECFYKNRNTRAGGEITRDVTEGYGPEMYVMKNAPHGKYVVRANYYGSDANRTQARTKVYVTVFEDFGGRKERVLRKTVALSRDKELRDVAEVFIEKQ